MYIFLNESSADFMAIIRGQIMIFVSCKYYRYKFLNRYKYEILININKTTLKDMVIS